ncbi:MAG: methyl-accepting chemotaxis protein [Pseudomonadota bacterium]
MSVMKIKHRLTFMVVLPLLFLMGFASNVIVNLASERAEANRTYESTNAAIVISDLVHALQVERGSSAGFLSSRGEAFANVMQSARTDVDEKTNAFASLKEMVASFDADAARNLDRSFDEIMRTRRDVDNLNANLATTGAAYTGLIEALSDVAIKMAGSGTSVELVTTATAYAAVMQAKESAGQQRSRGASGFGSGAFTPEIYDSFVTFGANKETFLYEAEFSLGASRWAQVTTALSAVSEANLASMRDEARRLAFADAPISFSNVTGPQWFEAATQRIDELKAVEDAIGELLANYATEAARSSTNTLIFVSTLCVLILLASGGYAYWQSRQIAQPLARFVGALERIRDADYSEEIVDTHRGDEIGECARAMSEVQSNLQAAAAAQLENRYKGTAFARANTPMFIVDRDFVVSYTNDASLALFAEKADIFRTEMPAFDPNVVGQKLTSFAEKLSDKRADLANPNAAPVKRDLLFGESRIGVEVAGIFDDEGTHLGNVFSWDDVSITRTNASKLEAVSNSQAVIEFSIDGIVQDANQNFLDTTGYRLEEITGKHHSMFLDPKDAQSTDYKELWHKLQAGQSLRSEVKRVNKAGEDFWLLASYNPVVDDDGVPFKVVEFASDITDEKTRQAEISSQLQAIGKSQAVFEIDLDGTILTANDNFLSALGHSSDAVVGKDYNSFVADAAQQSRAYQALWSELRKGGSLTEKFEHVGRDKHIVWFRSSYSPILNDEGRPTRIMVIATDITETVEQRRQADALQQNQSAEQAKVVSALSVGLTSLSEGDLTVQIDEAFEPQYEQLKVDFNRATAQLNKLIQSVIGSAAGISGNSKEMSQAADDLAHRTESQAATLEETAAALEELTASVKSASEGAMQASEVVAGAKDNAEASGEVVQMAVTAMDEIEKSSEHITQIIGVIEDIAFQTNLLALNAGVEAARAGDAGRGFAVVASEVRALAQRSSEAANEIKGIISTSAEHVDSGVKLVNRAGDALKQILTSVTDINNLVLEIASSSNEQSTGISEINAAVNQMDKGTQQNAAMVEETTAACHALNQETGELVGLVSKFKTAAEDEQDADWQATETKATARDVTNEKIMFKSRKTPVSNGSAALATDAEDVDGWHDF